MVRSCLSRPPIRRAGSLFSSDAHTSNSLEPTAISGTSPVAVLDDVKLPKHFPAMSSSLRRLTLHLYIEFASICSRDLTHHDQLPKDRMGHWTRQRLRIDESVDASANWHVQLGKWSHFLEYVVSSWSIEMLLGCGTSMWTELLLAAGSLTFSAWAFAFLSARLSAALATPYGIAVWLFRALRSGDCYSCSGLPGHWLIAGSSSQAYIASMLPLSEPALDPR